MIFHTQELPQAVCEILGLQNSDVTTPDSDTGEDENVGTTCSTSAFPSNTLPILAASEAKDDSSAQTLASPNACRLTPAWSFVLCFLRYFVAIPF